MDSTVAEDPGARAEEEAEQWLEAIERTLRRDEIAALRQWLKVPLHRKAILSRCRLWHGPDILAVLAELIPVETASRRMERHVGRLMLAIVLGVSGIGFITVLFAASKWWPDPNRPVNPLRAEQTFDTPIGGRRTIALPDGSTMMLNTATRVLVSYGPRSRDITLLRGEASFHPVADIERAFRVHASSRRFVSEREEAEFNVRTLASGDLELTVLRGRIHVPAGRTREPPSPALLRARVDVGDHTFDVAESGHLGPGWQTTGFLSARELEQRIAWRTGAMIFSNERLEDALAEIERYTPMRFVLADESLRRLRLNARVRIGAITDVLHALHENLGVGAKIRTDGTIELVRAADASKIAPVGATAVL